MRKALAILGFGISAFGLGQLHANAKINDVNIVSKAILPKQQKRESKVIKIDPYGGLDFPPIIDKDLILSPKEYGLSIYHGNKRNRSNRLRFSQNAKLKRRLK